MLRDNYPNVHIEVLLLLGPPPVDFIGADWGWIDSVREYFHTRHGWKRNSKQGAMAARIIRELIEKELSDESPRSSGG